MNDDPSGELPEVPAAGGGLEEETAPPVEADASMSGSVPIMRSLNDLSAAEEARSQPVVQFTSRPPSGSFDAAQSGSFDAAQSGSFDAAQSNDAMRPPSGSFNAASQSNDAMRPASTSGSFDQIINQASASGSHDQLAPASTSSPYYVPQQAAAPEQEVDDRPPMGFLKRTLLTFFVALLTFVVVAYLCVSQWVPSQTALMLMGGGMVLPTLLAGYFTSARSKRNIVLRIFPALVFGAAGMAGAYMWADDHVRAQAVPFTPPSVKGMKMMLADPSHEIALAGCKRFYPKHSNPDWWSEMFELLNQRPKLALECLDHMPEDVKSRIGGSLADRWARELVAGEAKEAKRACSIATGVATLPIPPQEAGARLLQCNLEAKKPDIQGCCGDALAGMIEDENDWAARLPAVVSTAKKSGVKSGVLAMSLHGQGLSEPQKKLAGDIGFASSPVRHVALMLACESVTKTGSSSIQHLQAALDTHCKVDMDQMPKGSEWAKVCRGALEKMQSEPAADPIDLLCQLTTVKPIAEAIAEARKLVHKAPPIITK